MHLGSSVVKIINRFDALFRKGFLTAEKSYPHASTIERTVCLSKRCLFVSSHELVLPVSEQKPLVRIRGTVELCFERRMVVSIPTTEMFYSFWLTHTRSSWVERDSF